MILKAEDVADRLKKGQDPNEKDPLVVSPHSDIETIRKSGSASIDLHLVLGSLSSGKLKSGRLRLDNLNMKPNSPKLITFPSETIIYYTLGLLFLE